MDAGDPAKAITILRPLTVSDPHDEAAFFLLGSALARNGQLTDALTSYQAALRLQPDDAEAQLSLSKVLLTLLRYSEAMPYLERYAQNNPQSLEGHLLLGRAARLNNQLVQSRQQLAIAVWLNSEDYDTELEWGLALQAAGESANALDALQHAAKLRPDEVEPHFQLSRLDRTLGRTAQAAEELASVRRLQAASRDKTRVAVLGNEGDRAFAAGDLAAAEKFYRSVLEFEPGNANAFYNLALVAGRRHDHAEERSLLEKGVAVDPRNARLHTQLGLLNLADGDTQAARLHFTAALAAAPEFFGALARFGVIEAQAGHLSAARDLLRRAVESEPKDGSGWRNLGLVLASDGSYAEAERALQTSISCAGESAAAWIALGRIQAAQHHWTAALSSFRVAGTRESRPDSEQQRTAGLLAEEARHAIDRPPVGK